MIKEICEMPDKIIPQYINESLTKIKLKLAGLSTFKRESDTVLYR